MRNEASEIFAMAGVPIDGNVDIYERVCEILGETMAELSVAHATGSISFRDRIDRFESQKNSLIDELKDMPAKA
jgi:hypothetical protein